MDYGVLYATNRFECDQCIIKRDIEWQNWRSGDGNDLDLPRLSIHNC